MTQPRESSTDGTCACGYFGPGETPCPNPDGVPLCALTERDKLLAAGLPVCASGADHAAMVYPNACPDCRALYEEATR